jgi:hypothetical protein
MKVRKLDASGDYVLGTGNDFFVNTPAGVAQNVKTRLSLLTGEWFVDTSAGTPWIPGILGKVRLQNYDVLLKERILGTTGLLAITAYSSSLDASKRSLSVTVDIDTIYGPATIQTTL